MENVITLGKLIGLLFLFCSRNDLARPVMGTIFLVELISKGVVCNKCIYICVSVCLSCPKMRRRNYIRSCSMSVLGGKN